MDLGIRPDKTTTNGADCTKTGNKKGSERFDALKNHAVSGVLSGFQSAGMELTRRSTPSLDWQKILTRQSQDPTTLTEVILPLSDLCPPQHLCCL